MQTQTVDDFATRKGNNIKARCYNERSRERPARLRQSVPTY